jgi:hypothetical protein
MCLIHRMLVAGIEDHHLLTSGFTKFVDIPRLIGKGIHVCVVDRREIHETREWYRYVRAQTQMVRGHALEHVLSGCSSVPLVIHDRFLHCNGKLVQHYMHQAYVIPNSPIVGLVKAGIVHVQGRLTLAYETKARIEGASAIAVYGSLGTEPRDASVSQRLELLKTELAHRPEYPLGVVVLEQAGDTFLKLRWERRERREVQMVWVLM